nr:AraC family transcriptional regulator [Vibrio maerlii]
MTQSISSKTSINQTIKDASNAVLNEENTLPKPAQIVTLPPYIENHDHSYTQIVIGLRGKSEFDVSGVGNIVGPGQGCVVTAGESHAFGGIIDKPDILVLNLPKPSSGDPLLLDRLNELNRAQTYFQLDSQIQKMIQMLVAEMQACPEDQLLARACNDTVMALLMRHTSQFNQVNKDHRLDMHAIDLYIETHMGRKISVAQLAASAFLGESQFHALFKDLMEITPHQYVLNKRIDMAKQLIKQGGASLSHIAEMTGFSNQSTFTHAFSRLQGCSPSQYKKMC